MDELRGQLTLVKEALSADPGNVELQALLAELKEVRIFAKGHASHRGHLA